MRSRRILISLLVLLILLLIAVVGLTYAQGPEPPASRAPQTALGTAFTYQGQLKIDGEPVDETCDMIFRLYDGASTQVGDAITETIVISDGLFTQPLNFGADAFIGDARWLDIQVKCPDDAGFTDLGRQALTAVPYALYASAAGEADLLDGLPAGAFWSTAGNAGTDPATDFLGTSDAVSLTLAVSGTTALRLAPTAGTPNIIGGYSGNHVTPGVVGVTIGGGGQSNNLNQVTADYAVIAGGDENIVNGRYGTIGGGGEHVVGGFAATVGGGASHVVLPAYASIAGGRNNTITGTAGASAIGGGRGNVITGSANFATIPGGRSNQAEGAYSFAAGRRAQALYDGDFVWADSTDADFAATGPDQFLVRATGGASFATSGAGVEIDGNTAWHAGNDGAGSGLDADLLDGQESAAYQQRVSGTCAVGSTVRAVNADGSVVCQADAPLNRSVPPRANTLTPPDTTGDVGQYTSITIGTDGLPIISYYEVTNQDLNVAHCADLACTSATITALDTDGKVGRYTSIAIGADGLPIISYYDDTNDDLKVAHCDDVACTSATVTALDTGGDVGQYTSITISADGLGLISYFDNANGDLKVAYCDDIACTSATSNTLDSAGIVGRFSSITTGADGLGLISYFDNNDNDLRVAYCSDIACTGAITNTLDSTGAVGQYTSITIGADGLGLISYYDDTNGDLKVAHCDDLACTGATVSTLDTSGIIGKFTSITIGADGLGVISYYFSSLGNLRVAHCSDPTCTSATVNTLDTDGTIGRFSSVTIGADGMPSISYYDDFYGDLKVVTCSNPFCTPYFRRR